MADDALPTSDEGSQARVWGRALYPVAIVIVLGAAAYMGALLVTFPRSGITEDIKKLKGTDAYQLWRALMAVLVGFSVATLSVSLPAYRRLRRRYRSAKLTPLNLLYLPCIALAGLFPTLLYPPKFGLNSMTTRVLLLVVVIMGAAWPAVASIWVVRPRARYLLICAGADLVRSSKERLEEWRQVRSALASTLTLLASIISLTVIVTGQLRNARIEAGTTDAIKFPVYYVLLYGAVFAAILAAIYLPVYARWQQVGERLVDTLYPLPGPSALRAPGSRPFPGAAGHRATELPSKDWEDGRKRLSDFLKLGTTGGAQLKTAFATLAPFLTSLLGYFIPTISK
jgi:hypothetical protein